MHKFCLEFLYILTIAKYPEMWYTIIVKGGRGWNRAALRSDAPPILQDPKKFLKNFQKPLDKSSKVWYNEYVIKREKERKRKMMYLKFVLAMFLFFQLFWETDRKKPKIAKCLWCYAELMIYLYVVTQQ